jgi:recombinational DNA repair ATPase RecF
MIVLAGELRKINISIMISYLRLIRNKRFINILFLDEVFSGLDIESIEKY